MKVNRAHKSTLAPTTNTTRTKSMRSKPLGVPNPYVCGGCTKQMTKKTWGSQCATCRKYSCGSCDYDCGCIGHSFLGDKLEAPASRRVSEYMLRNRHLLDLSFQGFTVEDKYGGLEFLSGDLTPILEKPPVVDRIFALKLREPIQETYADHQIGIWFNRFTPGELFGLKSEWMACIIPLLFNEQRFTVSLFFTARF
jgi:hypothetical protein